MRSAQGGRCFDEHVATVCRLRGDRICETDAFGSDLEGQIRPLGEHVRGVMIDACGHYLAEKRPERVVEELLRFFGETG